MKERDDYEAGSNIDALDIDIEGAWTPSGMDLLTPSTTIPASDYPTDYLSVLSLYEATTVSSDPVTSTAVPSVSVPSVSVPSGSATTLATTAKPASGPTYAIHIAYQIVEIPVLGLPGLPQRPTTQYWDEVWLSPTPNFCKGGNVRIKETGRPRTNVPQFAHTGTSAPTCDWIPGLGYAGPGHLSCDSDPTSVDCKTPDTKPTTCAQGRVSVTPVVECVWQGE